MSGTVYRKPAPGEPQFVKEGDKVTVGQSVCIIEVRQFDATCTLQAAESNREAQLLGESDSLPVLLPTAFPLPICQVVAKRKQLIFAQCTAVAHEQFDVQAMKLMNEIEADTAGTIVKFVAEDTKPIAPGDVICIIDPSG